MSPRYQFDAKDAEFLWAASLLLQKIAASPSTRPAQLVTVAKLQHVLSVLPRVTPDLIASVSVCCPRHKFEEIETFHWYDFGIECGRLEIVASGHFHDPMTGGDSFTTMTWAATPGESALLYDYRSDLWMVPDARSYKDGVEAIDLSADGYSVEVLDNDNPLLDPDDEEDPEEPEGEEDEEQEDSPDRWAISPVDDAEKLMSCVVLPDEVDSREPNYAVGVTTCDLCGCEISQRGLFVDGQLRGDSMWSNMCIPCMIQEGEGIGWGTGQLYAHQADGRWRQVAGFRPE